MSADAARISAKIRAADLVILLVCHPACRSHETAAASAANSASLWCSLQPTCLKSGSIVLLDVFYAVGRDADVHVVAAADQLLLQQIPNRELEVLARLAGHLFQMGLRKTRLVGLGPSLGVQHLEDRESDHLLRIEVVLGAARMRDELPAQVAPPLVNDVVLRPFFRIDQNM